MQPLIIRRSRLARLGLVATLLVASACGTPAAPELTSPTEIVLAMLATSEKATSTHVEVTLTGTADISLFAGATGGLDLTGATASGDLDLAKGAAHATFAVPSFFNVAGDLIAVDGKAYLKTTSTGALYDLVDLGSLPVDLTDAKGLVDDLGDFLMGDTVTLMKGADASCGVDQCYTVKTHLDEAALAKLLGGAGGVPAGLPIDLTGSTLDVTVLVGKDAAHHLGGLTIALGKADAKPLTIDVAFSKWDAGVTITAPPADQVKAG